jgi:hypothetical protein
MIADVIARHEPYVPVGFSKDYLELVIQKRWESVHLTRQENVREELLDGSRCALLMEGPLSELTYSLRSRTYWDLRVEALAYPWSATLLIEAYDGRPVYEESLYLDFARIKSIRVSLPSDVPEVCLRVAADPQSKGHQAWILGIGVVQ